MASKKIPYVNPFELFVRLEYRAAEEILAEYNDFYIFNMAQYAHIYRDVEDDKEEDLEVEDHSELAEKNAKAATDHFASLFGSKDFGAASLVGFRPAWYDIQKILLEEFKHMTPVIDSAMNNIAPTLRNIASCALFAEFIVSALEDSAVEPAIIKDTRARFVELFDRAVRGEVKLPEFVKTKPTLLKFKKPEQFIDFANTLFGVKK